VSHVVVVGRAGVFGCALFFFFRLPRGTQQ
jgi:hypothetical protein